MNHIPKHVNLSPAEIDFGKKKYNILFILYLRVLKINLIIHIQSRDAESLWNGSDIDLKKLFYYLMKI